MKFNFKNILCKFGFHYWKYSNKLANLTAIGFNKTKKGVEFKTRECINCNKFEYYTRLPMVNGQNLLNKWKQINKESFYEK